MSWILTSLMILISVLSTAIVLLTILFEGKLRKNSNYTGFKKEWKNLNGIAFFFIGFVFLFNLSETGISIYSGYQEAEQFKLDTIEKSKLIQALKLRHYEDSIQIDSLTKLTKSNIDSVSSINRNIIQVAADEIKERKKLQKQHNDYLFRQLKYELQFDAQFLVVGIDSNILKFKDSKKFFYQRAKYEYLEKYLEITTNRSIFKQINTSVDNMRKINDYCDFAQRDTVSISKEYTIKQIINMGKEAEIIILQWYYLVDKIDSYEEFENINFNTVHIMNPESIKDIIRKRNKRANARLEFFQINF